MSDELKRFSRAKKFLRNIFFILLATPCVSLFSVQLEAASKKNQETPSLQAPQEPLREKYIHQISPLSEEEEKDTAQPYHAVSRNKSLRGSTRFKVIDDFNSGELRNRFGSLWKGEKQKDQKVELTIRKEDARGFHSGSSLQIKYDLSKQQQYQLQSSLEKLNMSKADFLVLKCRMENPGPRFEGRVRVALSDWENKAVVRDITGACLATGGWNDVILPIAHFRGIDFRLLNRVKIFIVARDKPVTGKLYLDEIAFFGPEEVGFESVVASLQGFPRIVLDSQRREALLKTSNEKELLSNIAADTWRYFEYSVARENHFLIDHLKVGDFPLAATYTSPTNMAMDIFSTVAARELGILSQAQAQERMERILKTLLALKRWRGFFYNFYEMIRLEVTHPFISSVDNGWLAISLVVARQAFPGEIARTATDILNSMNFQELLDPENNHIFIGYDAERNAFTPYHYGLLVSEARATSLYAIGKGDIPREHWWLLYRTAPQEWSWQRQAPQGKMTMQEDINYFQGYYVYDSKKFVPSWGGSLFEFLMPTLVIDEKNLAPQGLGLNNRIATELHRDYALKEKKYPVWGISPASTGSGRQWQYDEYGIKKLGVKGYPDKGVITPHVSFLALETLPEDAIQNIRALLQYDIYGDCGFYDSISFPSRKVNYQYLALDQGMIFIAIANYLKNGVIKKYFHQDPVGKNIKDLLQKEKFFES